MKMEKEKQDAAYKFVDSMISQHDGKIGNKHFWFGWALREAFLSGIKYVSQPTITDISQSGAKSHENT